MPCSSCGFANEAGEKFCGGCGISLAAAADARAAQPTPARAGAIITAVGDGERRPVTVLFADLVDYTRMSRALDPEDVHAMLERFYAAADEIVERCVRALYNKARELCDRKIVGSEEECDLAFVFGIGFAMYLGGPMFYGKQHGWDRTA